MRNRLCLTGAEIVTPFRTIPDGVLVTCNGRIEQVGRKDAVSIPADAGRLHLPGRTVVPGFVDLHVHGMMGYCFDTASPDEIESAAAALQAHGVVCALATLVPDTPEVFLRRVAAWREYLDRPDRSPVFCGLHVEGPFLNRKVPGAIDPDTMWPADAGAAERLFETGGLWIRLMTIAPELPGALDIIRRAVHRDIVVSVGHSKASYLEIEDAIDCGLTQVTHIFNAMPLAHHREPGVLGAAYTHRELKVQLIGDGVHVHPAIMSFLVKVKGADSVILISDAMPACGLPNGDYDFAGDHVRLCDGVATRDDGTLAGSAMPLDGGVRNMVRLCRVPIGEAARMAGLNAARVLKLDARKGVLAAGFDADFVVLDADLNVEMTVAGGAVATPPAARRAG